MASGGIRSRATWRNIPNPANVFLRRRGVGEKPICAMPHYRKDTFESRSLPLAVLIWRAFPYTQSQTALRRPAEVRLQLRGNRPVNQGLPRRPLRRLFQINQISFLAGLQNSDWNSVSEQDAIRWNHWNAGAG